MKTERPTEREKYSGYACIRNNNICWDFNNENRIQIDSDKIVVIGEYTTAEGPYIDDWFITFVTSDGGWQSITRYAENIQELTKFLSDKFQIDFNISYLTGSAKWKSIVRYPKHLEEQELFEIIPPTKEEINESVWNQIKNTFGLLSGNIKLRSVVQSEIKNQNN